MSVPVGYYGKLLALNDVLTDDDLYEIRCVNNMNGQILFYGKAIYANADINANVWYIKALYYDSNGFLNYVRLPVDGPGFLYSWAQLLADSTVYFP